MALLLVALGAMKGTDFIKELVPWPLAAWTRSFIAAVLAGPLAFLTGARGQELVVLSAAGWGAAALLHEAGAVLSIITDNFKQQVILRAANRHR